MGWRRALLPLRETPVLLCAQQCCQVPSDQLVESDKERKLASAGEKPYPLAEFPRFPATRLTKNNDTTLLEQIAPTQAALPPRETNRVAFQRCLLRFCFWVKLSETT